MKNCIKIFVFLLLICMYMLPASAHVGSPGIIFEGNAGPYKILVNINPPDVIPGTAQVQVYITAGSVSSVQVRPIYWYTGAEGSPPAENMEQIIGVEGQYEGIVWLMNGGTASVEVNIDGSLGIGKVIVPIMATSTAQKEMEPALGWGLAGSGVFLFVLMITIIGNSVSDGMIAPGENRNSKRKSKIISMAVSGVVLILILFGGWSWWQSWADDYRQYMFRPYEATSTVKETTFGNQLVFNIDTSYLEYRKGSLPLSYLIPDHGKLMHMFLIREGSLDAFAHLHPTRQDSLTFEVNLPPLPEGRYFVFADIVRGNGFHETISDTFSIKKSNPIDTLTSNSESSWHKDDPDNTFIITNPIADNQTQLAFNNIVICGKPGVSTPLPDGSTAVWENDNTEYKSNTLYPLTFSILNPDGEAAELEPYMGMMGHAVVMKYDGSVYIHLHPVGNYSSASKNLIEARMEDSNREAYLMPANQFRDSVNQIVAGVLAMTEQERSDYLMDLMGHSIEDDSTGVHSGHSVVTFPYSFPEPGDYRIWIQMKRNGKVLNTAFDVNVKDVI